MGGRPSSAFRRRANKASFGRYRGGDGWQRDARWRADGRSARPRWSRPTHPVRAITCLCGERDYRRFRGRLAKIVTAEPVEGQVHFFGRLAGLEGDEVLLQEGRRTHRVPLRVISRARLEVEF